MTAGVANPGAPRRVPLRCWVILAALLALGAGLRFYQITKVGQWPDEFWSSVHLATGRGTEIFDLPAGVLIDPPPPTLLAGSPAWPHIWTGLRNVVHPPLYFIFLRWWMDLFGPGDFSTRTFSTLASLAGACVLFDIVRRTSGDHAALLAAAMFAISPLQINLSRETRSYPLLALFGLLACRAMVRIEREGASSGRLIGLAAAIAATALTHYFSLGALAGIFCYAAIQLRPGDRRKVIAAILAAAAFALIAWGPFLWQQRHEFFVQQSWSLEPTGDRNLTLIRVAAMPSALLYGELAPTMAWIGPAAVVYLLPLLFLRRNSRLMLWWFWVAGIIGSLLIYDEINRARLLATLKYTSLASAGVYALCATPLPVRKWWRWAIPYMLLASTILAVIQRIQEGPSQENGDWRGLALTLDRMAAPGDALVFYPNNFWGSPGMYYLAFSHYAEDSRRPVMFLNGPADSRALEQLAKYPTVWLIGPSAGADGMKYLPGRKLTYSRGFPNSGSIAELVR
ncbi:MAG: glycosyltransferase family 39 protein [Tepidisphaeraceae bacterium]|jgi:uncharacterized membrane protein